MSPQNRSKFVDKMDKLAVLLCLPRQNKFNAIPQVERPAGLPINALPGWESIPLHSKLPMLKCPDNQVIFSKNKIGRTFERWQRDFDSVCLNAKMDYNPLHDPHLKRFYSNEKLLKRLRDNGEITQNNDVICTLKEFNEHRIPLHETYLSLIRMERNRLNDDKQDLKMIAHAERVANQEEKNSKWRTKGRKTEEIIERKAELSQKRSRWIQTILWHSQRKQQQIESMRSVREVVLRHRKELHNFRIKHRLDVSLDIQRKRLIALKKHLQFKSDRLKANIKFIKENSARMAKEKARQSWEMHLQERMVKHEFVKQTTKQNEEEMEQWIANHMEKYQRKWNKIQQELEDRAHHRTKKLHKRKRLMKKIQRTLEKSDDDNLRNLTSEDIHDALQTAIDLENPDIVKKYDEGDYIYKAAKYILEGILAKFDKDLSGETDVQAVLERRLEKLFCEVKLYVIKRAAQIMSGSDIPGDKRCNVVKPRRYSLSKFVAFNSFSALIGKGSYALSELGIKMTGERIPTPAGSLTSVPIQPEGHDDDILASRRRPSLHVLTRDEQIFVEHLFIKFKRQLIVGIGRQVLTAIECHRNNKILDVRKELQDIDKSFLVKVMARSILSYAINPCNFHSNALLCQYALAGDIILSLQQSLLKPYRDPRGIVQPRSRCLCRVPVPMAAHCKRTDCGKR